MKKFILNQEPITLAVLFQVLQAKSEIILSEKAVNAIQKCRDYLDDKLANSNENIYGINTGFGSLYSASISSKELSQLQVNLVRSHACGTGEEVPTEIVRTMLLLKAMGLHYGHSGVQVETVNRLLYYYNHNITPVVYQQGSLGASGDLAPLAHIALTLIGEGEVYYKGEKLPTATVLKIHQLTGVQLQSKEGLALLNGTQFMCAYLAHCVYDGKKIIKQANLNTGLSLEAFDGRIDPFTSSVNLIRQQKGQIQVAEDIRNILSGSQLIQQKKEHVQDPYSFRCVPQVHGASLDTLIFAEQIVTNEMNAVTDNPTIFPDEDTIVSAGNFHGEPLAQAMDYLAIAIAEIGSISERRTYKLMGGTRNLPAFLVANPGLNSGFMIAQYTAASIVSQNKQLCTPASIDTIDSSNGQEDHVSMGANAATKLYRVVQNTWQVLAIERMAAAQAIEFRLVTKTSPILKKVHNAFRTIVPFIENDKYMSEYLRKSKSFIQNQD